MLKPNTKDIQSVCPKQERKTNYAHTMTVKSLHGTFPCKVLRIGDRIRATYNLFRTIYMQLMPFMEVLLRSHPP
jgi:hypothetical protein